MRNGIPPSTVDKAVTANQWLRILNQVRSPEVGIPLTMAEYPTYLHVVGCVPSMTCVGSWGVYLHVCVYMCPCSSIVFVFCCVRLCSVCMGLCVASCVCVCVCVCVLLQCVCVCVSLASWRLTTIGLKTLMDRLTNRELYPLAIALCGFLKYSPDEGEIPVLMHWARKKVRTHPLSV